MGKFKRLLSRGNQKANNRKNWNKLQIAKLTLEKIASNSCDNGCIDIAQQAIEIISKK